MRSSRISRLILVEPNAFLFAKLQTAAKDYPIPTTLFHGSLEEYIVAASTGCVDCVVCTLVLCSVNSPSDGVRHVQRLLKAGGRFVFLEHVHSEGGARRIAQATIDPVWHAISGCHLTRDTARTLVSAFSTVDVEAFDQRNSLWLTRPHIRGVATV